MAEYRLSAKVIGRSSGRSSVAAAAYRSGTQLDDQRTGLAHDYTHKKGVLHSQILAPDNAPDWMKDRAQLWNAVEAVERRKDAQLAREIQLSLPHELDEHQNRKLVLGFVQTHFVDRGMIADIAIHAPDRNGDQRNVHAHIMLTMRDLTSDGFSKKNRSWNTPEQLKTWRESWADHQNAVFRELGMKQRVDHRSYEQQGVEREPTQHLGPVANDMEKKGKASRIGNENRLRQQRNAQRASRAQEAAEVTRKLAAEKTRQAEIEAQRKTHQESQQMHERLEMERRHQREIARLEADQNTRNEARRKQLENERRTLQRELQATGWRKLMRDFLGKTQRDMQQLEANRRNIANMRQREDEERRTLRNRQQQERLENQRAQERRRADLERQLKQQKTEQQQKFQQAVKSKKSTSRTASNDRAQPTWTRPAATEQNNQDKRAQAFQKAAKGHEKGKQGQSAEQSKEAQKQKIREQMKQTKARGNQRTPRGRE